MGAGCIGFYNGLRTVFCTVLLPGVLLNGATSVVKQVLIERLMVYVIIAKLLSGLPVFCFACLQVKKTKLNMVQHIPDQQIASGKGFLKTMGNVSFAY